MCTRSLAEWVHRGDLWRSAQLRHTCAALIILLLISPTSEGWKAESTLPRLWIKYFIITSQENFDINFLMTSSLHPGWLPQVNFPLEDSPYPEGQVIWRRGNWAVPNIICFLLAVIFEGAIVHSDIHGRQIGRTLPGGNSSEAIWWGGGAIHRGAIFQGAILLVPREGVISRDSENLS